jgi:hypothetical protein
MSGCFGCFWYGCIGLVGLVGWKRELVIGNRAVGLCVVDALAQRMISWWCFCSSLSCITVSFLGFFMLVVGTFVGGPENGSRWMIYGYQLCDSTRAE